MDSGEGMNFANLSKLDTFNGGPALVWEFHHERRLQALEAKPNAAHETLAKFAKIKGPDAFVALSMNIDGLCVRAGHPKGQLLELHGSLFDLKCSGPDSDYTDPDNFGLEKEPRGQFPNLPPCPKCQKSILRSGVVWFGESLPKETIAAADKYIAGSESIDLVLVIGTTAQVWPASGYVDSAIEKGARVAMVNLDRGDLIPEGCALGLTGRDWFFVGDSAEVVPGMLDPVIVSI